jgi:hypothetical protein
MVRSAPVLPDTSVVTGSTTADVVLAICLITGALCLAIGLWEVATRRSAVLLACCVGGLGCNIIEPFWDQLGHLWFNAGNATAWTVFEHQAVAVHYPWWAVALYIQFGGFECWAFYLMFNHGATARTFWIFCGWQALCNLLIEIPLIQADVYQYYGEQPFRIAEFPIWWVFTNFGEVLAAALLYWLVTRYGMRAVLAAIVLVPSAFGAWELWAGWPIYAALNFEASMPVKQGAALVAAAISVVTLWLFCRAMPAIRNSAHRHEQAPEAPTARDGHLLFGGTA